MKRIIIIVEGQTEQMFCERVLQPYFNTVNIYVSPSKIKKSSGGIVHWNSIKKQIENHLKQDKTAVVSSMIDFYGIKDRHGFPGWSRSKSYQDKYKRIKSLEDAMQADIAVDYRNRFIPYLQLHEFEGLLFSDINVYQEMFEDDEFVSYEYLIETISEFENPEMINEGKDSAPSVRLKKRILKSYNKVVHGILIAEEIGLEKIREKCPGFDAWIKELSEV